MLTTNSNYTWAQIGNYQSPSSRSVYAQWWDYSVWDQHSWSAQPVNSFTYYTVLYDPNSTTFTFEYAGNPVWYESHASWVPTGAMALSETTDISVQMMGAVNNTVDFLNTHVYYSGAWHTMSGTPGVSNNSGINVSGYFGASGNGAHYWTWDKQCPT
jgi:hypothetical protein